METKFIKLNEIRDELAEQFWKRTWDNFGSDFMDMHKHFCNDNIAEYFSAGFDAAMERVGPLVERLELIYESRDKTLLGRCCIEKSCFISDGTCSAQITAHNAFVQNAMEAKEALAKFYGEL